MSESKYKERPDRITRNKKTRLGFLEVYKTSNLFDVIPRELISEKEKIIMFEENCV